MFERAAAHRAQIRAKRHAVKTEEPAKEYLPEPITPDMLPDSISAWVQDVCERIESPFEIGAVSALCFIGNLIGNKAGIRPKRNDNWTVVPNLWGLIIGKPSIKKTPVYSELYKSIGRLQKQAEGDHAQAMVKFSIEEELYAARLKEAKKSGDEEQLKKLIEDAPQVPIKRRYVTQDGTVEAITEIIKQNPQGLLVSRDELSGWLKQMDRAGREGERAFYLEAWNGTGSFSVDRIGRGSTYLPRLTLGVIGNIQPTVIRKYVYEAVKEKRADGFLQRFQLAIFAEPIEQKLIDRSPNKLARSTFDEIINYAAGDQFFGVVRDEYDNGDGIPFYRLSSEAQAVFNEWYLSNAKEASEAFNEALEGHLAKYPKLFASLALIFHVCDLADAFKPNQEQISEENAKRALRLVNALKSHAYKLYSTFEIEEQRRDDMADRILEYIGAKELPVTVREITHGVSLSGRRPTKDDITKAVKGVYQMAGSKIIKRL